MEYTIGSSVFDGWKITRMLGEGSYGKVFAIEKTDFGFTTKAALKLIRIPKSPAEVREALSEGMDEKSVTSYFEEIVERFVREIAVMSQLKGHPNVVSCENYRVEPHAGTIGWDILIKMELLTGLQDYQQTHPMDEAAVKNLAEQICRALVFIQKQGLIHRDIKPANIFVDNLGQFKLGDFGVARTAEKTLGGMSKQGTENYMAPEVYHGKPYGFSVDIYSLGLVLYRLMNGNRLPFYPPAPQRIGLEDRENALISRMMGEILPPPRDASPEFTAIILKACAHNPANRYQTAAQMLEDLVGKETLSGKQEKLPPVSVSGDEEDGGSINIFGGKKPVPPMPGPEEDEDGGTVNIFGGKKPVPPMPGPEEDEDGGTVNIFGGKKPVPPMPGPEEDEDGGTVNIFGGKKPVPPMPGPEEDEDGGTVNIFSGRKVTPPMPEEEESEGPSRREAMLKFWQQNLTKLWISRKEMRWNAYFAPDIPLQICSNAIFNITQNEVRREEILAILDCTPDTRVPCGCGVVITQEKMYINLLVQDGNPRKYPKAVLEFARLKRVWNGVQNGALWQKYPCLHWETTDGRTTTFGLSMYQFLDYRVLEKMLNSPEWHKCLSIKK